MYPDVSDMITAAFQNEKRRGYGGQLATRRVTWETSGRCRSRLQAPSQTPQSW